MDSKTECKTCQNAAILYEREREDRFSNAYAPSGYVLCHKPGRKRAFFRRDACHGCADYAPRARGG